MRPPTGGNPRSALWLAASLLVAAGVAAPSVAEARGSVGFGFGFGVPLAGPPAYYYPPPVYYPPPAYYYPPPAYYYPPPVADATPPSTVGDQASQDQTCREYQATTTIDGRPQASYGTACLQPDGTWRIVR
jgi:hypothetical protein